MPETAEELLTVAEAARVARVSKPTLYRRIAEGSVPAIRVGDGGRGPLRVPRVEFRAWLYGNPRERE